MRLSGQEVIKVVLGHWKRENKQETLQSEIDRNILTDKEKRKGK